MIAGIASALATKASPVAPEKRALDVDYGVYIDRITGATQPKEKERSSFCRREREMSPVPFLFPSKH